MKWIYGFTSVVLLIASVSAFAQSDAYNAGYDIGQQVGRFAAQFVPIAAIIIVIGAAWMGYRAWRRRGTSNDGKD